MRIPTFCAIVLLTLVSPVVLLAGYVWTENGSGAYAGTAAPWVSDSTVTGKWVNVGTTNAFTDEVNVTNGENFTITGSGTIVTISTISRVAQNATPTTLTVQSGATLNVSNTLTVSDSSGTSTGYLVVNGGTLTSTNTVRIGYHNQGYLQIYGGGSVSANYLQLGGVDDASNFRKGIGHLTIGTLADATSGTTATTGALTVNYLQAGLTGPGTSEIVVNTGTITVKKDLTLGGTTQNSDGKVHDVKLDIKSAGIVTVSNTFSAANHAQKNALINIDGGTLSTYIGNLGDAAGSATLTITNSGSLKASERVVVGSSGTGTLDLQSGSILVGLVKEDSSIQYKTLFIGKNAGSNGTLKVSGGTVDSSYLTVGENGTAKVELSGGTITTRGGQMKIGEFATSTGLFEMTGGTCVVATDTNVGMAGVGTFLMNIPAKDLTEALNFTTNKMNVSTSAAGKTSTATFTSGKAKVTDTLTVAQNGSLLVNGANADLTVKTLQISCDPGASNVEISAGSVSATTVNVNSYGTLKVSGANASLTASEIFLTSNKAAAAITITNGTVKTTGAFTLGNYGTLTVNGADAKLNVGSISLKTATGKAVMNLNAGTVTTSSTSSATFFVGQNAELNLAGATITGGNMTINEGGIVRVSGSTDAAPAVIQSPVLTIGSTGSLYVNSPLESNLKNQQMTLNGKLDIGKGGKYSYIDLEGTLAVFRAGEANATPTLNIHDGGTLEVSGNIRFLMGDKPTGVVTINVDGAGSLLSYSGSEFKLGYHGTTKASVTNGGKISSTNLMLGNNNAEGKVIPSELTISGAGSAVEISGTFAIGSDNQKGILNLNASNTGFGTLTVGTLARFTKKESEINIGIDHGVSMIQNFPATGYEIIKATKINNWVVNDSSVWKPTVSGGTVTVTPDASKKAEGVLGSGEVTITDGLKMAGWAEYNIPEHWNIAMSFNGATSADEVESLAAWLNEGSGGLNYQAYGNSVTLYDLPASSGIYAWDFTDFNAQYGANLSLGSVTAYIPEPSTFVLLALGIFALLRGRRERNGVQRR